MNSILDRLHVLAALTSILLVTNSLIVAFAQTDDESVLRVLAQHYTEAYAREDLSAMMKLWSLRSQEVAGRFEAFQNAFDKGDFAFSNVRVTRISIHGTRAIIRLSADLHARTSNGESRSELFERNFALVWEQGNWKIWRDVSPSQPVEDFLTKGAEWRTSSALPSEEQFASALVDASPADRQALLTDNPEMVAPALVGALLNQAKSFLTTRMPAKALDGYLLAQDIAEHFADKDGIAIAQFGIAATRRASNNQPQALQGFEKALELFLETGNKPQVAVTWSEIAKIHMEMSKPERALDSYKKALTVFEALNDRASVAETLEGLSTLYHEQGNYVEALKLLERCLHLREALGQKGRVASTLRNLGNINYYQENYEPAIEYYLKAVAAFEAVKDSPALAETMSYLASSNYAVKNYDRALEYYRRALVLQEGFTDRRGIASTLFGLGSTYLALRDFASALDYLNKNRSMLEVQQDKTSTVDTIRLIGLAHVKLRNFEAARAAYERCLNIYEERGDKQNAAELLVELGNVSFAQEQYDTDPRG